MPYSTIQLFLIIYFNLLRKNQTIARESIVKRCSPDTSHSILRIRPTQRETKSESEFEQENCNADGSLNSFKKNMNALKRELKICFEQDERVQSFDFESKDHIQSRDHDVDFETGQFNASTNNLSSTNISHHSKESKQISPALKSAFMHSHSNAQTHSHKPTISHVSRDATQTPTPTLSPTPTPLLTPYSWSEANVNRESKMEHNPTHFSFSSKQSKVPHINDGIEETMNDTMNSSFHFKAYDTSPAVKKAKNELRRAIVESNNHESTRFLYFHQLLLLLSFLILLLLLHPFSFSTLSPSSIFFSFFLIIRFSIFQFFKSTKI